LEAIRARGIGTLRYLNRVVDRMHKLAFPEDDEALLAATPARDALHVLTVKLHYLSCSDHVGESGLSGGRTADLSRGQPERRQKPNFSG
jgi:hypothetical protein